MHGSARSAGDADQRLNRRGDRRRPGDPPRLAARPCRDTGGL